MGGGSEGRGRKGNRELDVWVRDQVEGGGRESGERRGGEEAGGRREDIGWWYCV